MQKLLDASLVQAMQLCIEACRQLLSTRRAKVSVVDDPDKTDGTTNGLELDLKVLKELDPSIFGPLFQ